MMMMMMTTDGFLPRRWQFSTSIWTHVICPLRKDSRRYFYWRVKRRVLQDTAEGNNHCKTWQVFLSGGLMADDFPLDRTIWLAAWGRPGFAAGCKNASCMFARIVANRHQRKPYKKPVPKEFQSTNGFKHGPGDPGGGGWPVQAFPWEQVDTKLTHKDSEAKWKWASVELEDVNFEEFGILSWLNCNLKWCVYVIMLSKLVREA